MKKTFKRILAGAMACALTIGISATAVAVERPRVVLELTGYSKITGTLSYKTYGSNTVVFTSTSKTNDGRYVPYLSAGLTIRDVDQGKDIYNVRNVDETNKISAETYGMTQKTLVATGRHNARTAKGIWATGKYHTTVIAYCPE